MPRKLEYFEAIHHRFRGLTYPMASPILRFAVVEASPHRRAHTFSPIPKPDVHY